MADWYEVELAVEQRYAVIVEADDREGAINRALLDQAGRVVVVEMTSELEQLGRQAKATSIKKMSPDDPRRPPRIRN